MADLEIGAPGARFMVRMHARSERGQPMNRDSQTRMTNDEIPRNDQTRMSKPATAQLRAIGHSGFGFLSSLVIGHSSFNGLCKSGSGASQTGNRPRLSQERQPKNS